MNLKMENKIDLDDAQLKRGFKEKYLHSRDLICDLPICGVSVYYQWVKWDIVPFYPKSDIFFRGKSEHLL